MPQVGVGERFGPFTLLRSLSVQGLRERWVARWADAPERPPVLLEILPGPLAEHRGLPRPIREELAHLRVFGHRRFTTPGRLALEEHRIGFSFEIPGIVTLEEVLERLRRQHSPMPAPAAVELARKVTEALVALHARTPLPGQTGAHLALRPAHIFLSQDGEVALSAAWVAPLERLWPWGPPVTAWPYLAPEEVRGQKGDARSDLYSVGRILLECLRLRPSQGTEAALMVRHLQKEAELSELKDLGTTPALVHLLERLIAHQPSARFVSAENLLGVLTDLQRQLGYVPTLTSFLTQQGWNDEAVSNTREIQRSQLPGGRGPDSKPMSIMTAPMAYSPTTPAQGIPIAAAAPSHIEDPFASLEAALSDLGGLEDFPLVVEHDDGAEPIVEPLDEDAPTTAGTRVPNVRRTDLGDADLAALAVDLDQILPEEAVAPVGESTGSRVLGWLERIGKDGSRTRYPMDGTAITIGRSPSCTIHITGDGRVSRLHCRVILERTQFILEDAGSNNGTLVDGVFVKRHLLKGGEEIIIGGTMLQYTPAALNPRTR